MELQDKVALITGAGSGIGQAMAILFALISESRKTNIALQSPDSRLSNPGLHSDCK